MKIRKSGEARDIRNANINFAPFGVAWKAGDTLRVYYPLAALEEGEDATTERDVPVASGFFYKADAKERLGLLGRYAFPTKHLDCDDKKDPRISSELPYKMASVARTMYEASLEKLDDELMKKIQDKPKQTKALTDAHANKKKKLEDAGPAITGPKYEMYIEAVVVPIDPKTLEIKKDGIMCVRQSLSEKRRKAILNCANDPSSGVTVHDSYVEVVYNFPNEERNVAGQTLPGVVAPDYRLSAKHPSTFESEIKPKLDLLTQFSDIMVKRNSDFNPYDEGLLLSAFNAWIIDTEELLAEYHANEKFVSRFTASKDLLERLGMEKYVPKAMVKEESPNSEEDEESDDNTEDSEDSDVNNITASEYDNRMPSPTDILQGNV